MTCYHATAIDNLASIQSIGLIPQIGPMSLAAEQEEAAVYVCTAAAGVEHWGRGDEYGLAPRKSWAILTIEVPTDEWRRFRRDCPEALDNCWRTSRPIPAVWIAGSKIV